MDEKTEIYQKKTIDAALSTIITKMEELTVDKAIKQRRWIWELIQNADDCATEDGVTIWVRANQDKLVFSHNGNIFTYNNLVDLITQISSKRTDDDEKIGKFGTGFISTHLISEIVTIKGIYHKTKDSSDFKHLELIIDRSGKTDAQIKDSLIKAIDDLERIDSSPKIEWSYDKNVPTTSFVYDLTNKYSSDVKDAIESGAHDLNEAIPFVFAFSHKIKEINFNEVKYVRSTNQTLICENICIVEANKVCTDQRKPSDCKKVLVYTDPEKEVSIAMLVKPSEDNVAFNCLPMRDMTKLYCTFPLIGTENFAFPIAIHSSKFRVLQERNDINEENISNKEIVKKAIQLYKNLIIFVTQNNWHDIFNLCYIESKKTQFQQEIYNALQLIYNVLPIVTVRGELSVERKVSLYVNEEGKLVHNVIIPHMEKADYSDQLWDLISQMKTKPIPVKESYKQWSMISPNSRVSLQPIYEHFLKGKNLSEFCNHLNNVDNTFPWLNKFYSFWIDSSSNQEFLSKGIVPNQLDQFLDISKLKIDNCIDDDLKNFYMFFEPNFKAKLLHKGITILENLGIESISNEDVANKLCDHIRKQFSDESNNTIKRTTEVQEVFNKLSDWFLKNPETAKQLFKDIFDKKHQLSSQEETIRRLELASNIENTLNQNKLELNQLTIIIQESGKLLQLFEQGEQGFSEDAKKLLQHIVSKSIYSKQRFDSLLERSIKSVYEYLFENPNYEVKPSLEEWQQSKYSDTVFPAFNLNENREIVIVIRPSDDDKIIFIEDTELEALDNTAYELWTDNEYGKVRIITLGDLLKTTGITSIPLKNIFSRAKEEDRK